MSLEFRHVSHAYGRMKVLNDVSLEAADGEITCLLGPSGCGKSTLLRLAAGLLPLRHGEIHLGGEKLLWSGKTAAPENLPVGLVFQDGALFPHLSVEDNVGFGLKKNAERNVEIAKILEQVGLAGFQKRYPHTLSGGQQQRVALARALAPKPRVLLLDEPFANIDIERRRVLREHTRRMLKEDGGIVILVTHDPEEALGMADRIAVLSAGELVQSGPPSDLYDHPATLHVATLVGGAHSLVGDISSDAIATPFGVWPHSCLARDDIADGPADIAIRSNKIELTADADGLPITDIRMTGVATHVTVVGADNESLVVEVPNGSALAVGDKVAVAPQQNSVFAFAR